jgi:AraC-like DNA-binding protein
MVCVKGKGWCSTEAGRFEVSAGQVVILEPGRPHAYGADGDDPWTLWWLHVAGREVSEFLTVAGMTNEAPVRNLSDVYRIVTLMTEVVQWMERDSTTQSLLAAGGAAWHLLALLASDRTTTGGTADAIDKAAAYLRSHVNEHVSIEELASMARLSSSHFGAQFRKQIGYPVLQYQTQLRMARAREKLDTTNDTISSIAESVGYPDPFYFARQFKQIHGVTPRQYRTQHKG